MELGTVWSHNIRVQTWEEDQMVFKSLYLPDMIKWDEESLTDTYGRLEIVPLERGFGRTLGNALRRVLLSSLEGYAPVSLQIDGVKHEFSTISGVVEDVPEIVLNVKSLIVSLQGEDSGVLKLSASKEGKYTGKDLSGDAHIKVINKSQEIVKLDGSGKLSLEICFEKGKGFIASDEWGLHGKDDQVGTILLDSWFCPVRKVNFQIKSARVGDRTDYDHLIMDITTDGSIGPEDAIREACEILIEHLGMIPGGVEPEEKPDLIEEEIESREDLLTAPIDETEIPTRIVNVLKSGGIKKVGDLISKKSEEILEISGFGPSSLDAVREVLEKQGLEIKD
jgi:DNA-directed RNA polymerase subunit alpha